VNNILIRYGEPSKYDHGPYGTICKVIKATNEMCDVFVQLSLDESMPAWSFLGAFAIDNDQDIIRHVHDRLDK
jgi:hypothetical protein